MEQAKTTKLIDKKGRLMLGAAFAGRMVIVDDSDPEQIVISPAVAIPEREAWLYKNKDALKRVRKGLEQAREGEFSEAPPDLDEDAALADQLE
jgi:ABC-type nitrate/sulfonate/bicarbonate transport system substrate-binding protein